MAKVFVILGNRWQDYNARCLARSIHDELIQCGFANVTIDNRGAPSMQPMQGFPYRTVLSEHYLATAPFLRPGDTPISSEQDMRVQPPICEHPPSDTTIIAVVGGVNSGKSFVLRTIAEFLQRYYRIPAGQILEDYMPGTFGWPVETFGKHTSDGIEERLKKEMEIHISGELSDARRSTTTLGYYLEEKGLKR